DAVEVRRMGTGLHERDRRWCWDHVAALVSLENRLGQVDVPGLAAVRARVGEAVRAVPDDIRPAGTARGDPGENVYRIAGGDRGVADLDPRPVAIAAGRTGSRNERLAQRRGGALPPPGDIDVARGVDGAHHEVGRVPAVVRHAGRDGDQLALVAAGKCGRWCIEEG